MKKNILIALIVIVILGGTAYITFSPKTQIEAPAAVLIPAQNTGEIIVHTGVITETLSDTGNVSSGADIATGNVSSPVAAAEKSWDNYVKPSSADLKTMLTPLQYNVTQESDTEQPFNNLYRDNHAAGIYVDIVSGEPLFSSLDKYESGTGRPSFTKPLVAENITYTSDSQLSEERTEVRSVHADSHLGHIFDDGPAPTGKRYCMNSASLKFIPAADLDKEGYGEFAYLFSGSAQ